LFSTPIEIYAFGQEKVDLGRIYAAKLPYFGRVKEVPLLSTPSGPLAPSGPFLLVTL